MESGIKTIQKEDSGRKEVGKGSGEGRTRQVWVSLSPMTARNRFEGSTNLHVDYLGRCAWVC